MSIFHQHPSLDELNSKWLPKLDQSLGVKIIEVGAKTLSAEFLVTNAIIQPFGILHGGFSCMLGESLGSIAGYLTLKDAKQAVVGQGLQALHFRSAAQGTWLVATAEALHLGRRSQIWETKLHEKISQRLISRVTLTLALIEQPK